MGGSVPHPGTWRPRGEQVRGAVRPCPGLTVLLMGPCAVPELAPGPRTCSAIGRGPGHTCPPPRGLGWEGPLTFVAQAGPDRSRGRKGAKAGRNGVQLWEAGPAGWGGPETQTGSLSSQSCHTSTSKEASGFFPR